MRVDDNFFFVLHPSASFISQMWKKSHLNEIYPSLKCLVHRQDFTSHNVKERLKINARDFFLLSFNWMSFKVDLHALKSWLEWISKLLCYQYIIHRCLIYVHSIHYTRATMLNTKSILLCISWYKKAKKKRKDRQCRQWANTFYFNILF